MDPAHVAGPPRRRTAPAALLLTLGALLAGVGSAAGQVNPPVPDTVESDLPPDPDSARALDMTVEPGFSVAAVGDLIVARPISHRDDARFEEMLEILRRPTVTTGNMEESLVDIRSFDGHPQAEYGGTWLLGVPGVAADLRLMGFDMLARANNHTTDLGVEGMEETGRLLDEAGLTHAGSGHDLAAARAARYAGTPEGDVAIVSAATTFTPMSRAMDPLGEAPGRPGLSAIRTTEYALVTPEEMETLRQIKEAQPEESREDEEEGEDEGAVEGEGEEDEDDDELSLFGVNYRIGDRHGVEYEMEPIDVRELERSIETAKRNADFVIVHVHAHEPGNWSETPAAFLEELAHRAVDAGADQFVGHGPHQLRGIEIYRGKPIFYSLANFIFQNEPIYPVAMDAYERFDTDPAEVTDPELNRRQLVMGFEDDLWFESVIAVSRFGEDGVSEIRLHPITLGYGKRNPDRGVPRLAEEERGREILERVRRLSEPYGTDVTLQDGVGVIEVEGGETDHGG